MTTPVQDPVWQRFHAATGLSSGAWQALTDMSDWQSAKGPMGMPAWVCAAIAAPHIIPRIAREYPQVLHQRDDLGRGAWFYFWAAGNSEEWEKPLRELLSVLPIESNLPDAEGRGFYLQAYRPVPVLRLAGEQSHSPSCLTWPSPWPCSDFWLSCNAVFGGTPGQKEEWTRKVLQVALACLPSWGVHPIGATHSQSMRTLFPDWDKGFTPQARGNFMAALMAEDARAPSWSFVTRPTPGPLSQLMERWQSLPVEFPLDRIEEVLEVVDASHPKPSRDLCCVANWARTVVTAQRFNEALPPAVTTPRNRL